MREGPPRIVVAVALAFALVLVVRLAGWWGAAGITPRAVKQPTSAPVAPRADLEAPRAPATNAATHDGATEDAHRRDPLAEIDTSAQAWARVDFDEIRELMPDNLYWGMGYPTKDPEVLAAREAERERWNTEYGKVLSNTATDEEIDAYYAHRERLSRDYAEFAGFILAKYGRTLEQRDVALLKLSVELHLARLEEIPRQITEAHARHAAHDAARRAWLEDQRAFEQPPRDAE